MSDRKLRAERRLEARRSAPARASLDAEWRAIATEALQGTEVWGTMPKSERRAAIRRYIKQNRTVW
jgi:hypothetical protein